MYFCSYSCRDPKKLSFFYIVRHCFYVVLSETLFNVLLQLFWPGLSCKVDLESQ